MVHEVCYDGYHGPGPERLFTALRWKREAVEHLKRAEPESCPVEPLFACFHIADGVGNIPVWAVVHCVKWPDDADSEDEVDIEVAWSVTDERWFGRYDLKRHTVRFVNEEGRRSVSVMDGILASSAQVLAAMQIETVADLVTVRLEWLLEELMRFWRTHRPDQETAADFASMLYSDLAALLKRNNLRFFYGLEHQGADKRLAVLREAERNALHKG